MLCGMTTAAPLHMPPTVPRADPPSERPRLISRSAAARRLDVDPRSIDRYVERGLLVAHRDPVRRRTGIEVAGIERIEAQRVIIDGE
jgi:hypothetical protein